MLGCVILAAGNASRFGKNKLLTTFAGTPLVRLAMEAVPERQDLRTVAVTQYDEVAALAEAFGFSCVRNTAPELGISRSVRLGTEALLREASDAGQKAPDGILYLVADQPLLRRQTVALLLDAFSEHPDRIVVPTAEGRSGNPCIFPRDLFPALLALEGDRGGKQVVRANPERVLAGGVPARELLDVDTAEALDALR